MSDLETRRETLQETMNFMAALTFGVEQITGRGANGMAYVAGKKLGKKFSEGVTKTDDIEKALEETRKVLQDNHCLWGFEPFKLKGQADLVQVTESGDQKMTLVFRDCMIRQSLFRYGHEQKNSLCNMMYGFFAGVLEEVLGAKATLEIDHAGENACLKTLTIQKGE